jgi:prepilin-type N-terminal cleavage/methylation domain-containing protein
MSPHKDSITFCSLDQQQRGFSLVELLVAFLMAGIILAGVSRTFIGSARRSYDSTVIAETEAQGRALLDQLSFDIRMAGSGMPLGQTGFLIGGAGLGDAPLPILTTAAVDEITLRLNETGRSQLLDVEYTPGMADTDFTIVNNENLAAGDLIYLSNMPQGKTDGMSAVVDSIAGNTVNVVPGFVTTPGAIFPAGSTVTKVTQLRYNSAGGFAGVFRDDGSGPVSIAANADFTLTYLDGAGATMGLPLAEPAISADLAAIDIAVQMQSARQLRDGTNYIANARQRVALRNLNLNR